MNDSNLIQPYHRHSLGARQVLRKRPLAALALLALVLIGVLFVVAGSSPVFAERPPQAR